MSEETISSEEIKEMDKKEFRKEFPSGWMELTRYETLVMTIDAMLEAPATREFTIGEISNKSGASERSISSHIDTLVELGIVTKLEEGRDEPRYSVNNDGVITKKLYDLNTAVQQVKEGSLPKTTKNDIPEENSNGPNSGQDGKYNVPEEGIASPKGESKTGFSPTDTAATSG